MKIAIFGGTFDPIHIGHIEAAKAAADKFHLSRILFIPTGCPPHKVSDGLTSFEHRFAMVALACAGDPRFIPCPIESPRSGKGPNYSIDSARAIRESISPRDQLFFLIGVDAFLDLPQWKDFRALLELMDFIIISRPGFDSRKIHSVVPQELLAAPETHPRSSRIPLRKTTLHVLRGVEVPVASRSIRDDIRGERAITEKVPYLIEEYIFKEGLYRQDRQSIREDDEL